MTEADVSSGCTREDAEAATTVGVEMAGEEMAGEEDAADAAEIRCSRASLLMMECRNTHLDK